MANKLRALVVGSGWGRNHALAYQAHPDVELVAICGRTESRRNRGLARELQVPLVVGLDKALREFAPDLVSCATNEKNHEEVTIAALEAGCHVCCEKLMADTVAAAERMVTAGRASSGQLMIGYNYRFSPSAVKLRELVDTGALGDLAFGSALTFGYCLHHTLDLMCSLLGEVEEVFCILHDKPADETAVAFEVYDEFAYSASKCRSIQLRFRGDLVGSLISSDYIRVGHPAVRLDLVGSKARCTMSDIVGRVTTYKENREGELWLPSLIMDRLDLGSTTQALVAAFVDAVRDGKPVPVPGEQGLHRLQLERALWQSAAQNRPVRL